MKRMMAISLLGLLLYQAAGYAECTRPEPPEIPDPNTAVTAQMVKAQNDVKTYVAEAEKFLKCVRSDRDHDKVVDEMKQVADNFNQAVRAFKERMSQ